MIKEKIDKASKIIYSNTKKSNAVKGFLCFLAGGAFSLGSIAGSLHPLGIAFVSVTKRKYLLFSALGSCAGLLFFGFDENTVRYITAILICSLSNIGFSFFETGRGSLYSMGASFFSCLLTGVVLDFAVHSYPTELLVDFGEATLCGGCAFFFYRALNSSYKRLRLRALPLGDVGCIVISLSLMLMSLQEIKLFGVSPARISATVITLLALRFLGDRWGIILALAFGFTFSLGNENMLFITGALSFSVMVGSLFSSLGIFALCGGFLLSFSFFCIVSQNRESLYLFIEAFSSSLIFVLMPTSLTSRLEAFFEAGKAPAYDGALRQSLVLKLRFASSAMAAISESVEEVRDRINKITRRENEEKRASLSEEEYLRREIILEKTNQIRMVASDQFFGVADMLEDLAFEFDEAEIFNSSASSKIRRLLSDFGIYPRSISAIEDKYGRIRVEILSDTNTPGLDNPALSVEIGKICGRYFDEGTLTSFKEEIMLSFFEKPNYSRDTGFAQHSAQGKFCGDTIKTLCDNKGHSILIISDGMGKGSRAALDGAMGAGLLSKLINAGFGFDSALKVVNCALLVKSNDESLATLDIANIDLFTGKCEIFKAGAPASYIIKGKHITKCELSSMPAGILRGTEFAKRTAVLRPEDRILLLSDGISELGEGWINETVKETDNLQPQECADYILEKALESSQGKPLDDMSVIYARLERN
ncbi:MAG: SpoIIE family protein phosphatase [Eubacterium sp.]|nr:SpoIIE family protein phosphatase [Eubacterium sp.]